MKNNNFAKQYVLNPLGLLQFSLPHAFFHIVFVLLLFVFPLFVSLLIDHYHLHLLSLGLHLSKYDPKLLISGFKKVIKLGNWARSELWGGDYVDSAGWTHFQRGVVVGARLCAHPTVPPPRYHMRLSLDLTY